MSIDKKEKNKNQTLITIVFFGINIIGGCILYRRYNHTNMQNMEQYFNKAVTVNQENTTAYIYPINQKFSKDKKGWTSFHLNLNNNFNSLNNTLQGVMHNHPMMPIEEREDIFKEYFMKNHMAQEKKSIIVIEDIPVYTNNEFETPINNLLHIIERKIKISPHNINILLTSSDNNFKKLIDKIYGPNCFHKINSKSEKLYYEVNKEHKNNEHKIVNFKQAKINKNVSRCSLLRSKYKTKKCFKRFNKCNAPLLIVLIFLSLYSVNA